MNYRKYPHPVRYLLRIPLKGTLLPIFTLLHFTVLNDEGKISRDTFKPDHLTPVTSVDSCPKQNLFLSSSVDGVLKIWLEEKVLITEVAIS